MNLRLATALAAAALALPVAGAAAVSAAPLRSDTDPRITDGTLRHQLDRARRTWTAAHVRSYRYTVDVACFCAPAKGVVYVVRDGVPRVPRGGERSLATVPRLFRRIQQAIDAKVANLDVTYGRRGVPRSISIDGAANIADDEVAYAISRFTRLA